MKWRWCRCLASCSWEERLPTEGNCASVEKTQHSKVGEFDKCKNEKKKRKSRKSLAHFEIIASLFKKKRGGRIGQGGGFHTQACACMDWYDGSRANTSIRDASNLLHTNTHTHILAQRPANTKRGRWAPFCVELKAAPQSQFPPPTPLSSAAGVHQPSISRARAPAWSPGVARVTLGLLPRHRLDQRGPGAIISALAASTPGLEWQIGSRGERVTRAGQEIYFEEERCVSGVGDKRATFYVVNCMSVTRTMCIDPCPKDTRTRRRLSLVTTMPERLSPKVTRNMTGLEGFSLVSRLVASICVPLPLTPLPLWTK